MRKILLLLLSLLVIPVIVNAEITLYYPNNEIVTVETEEEVEELLKEENWKLLGTYETDEKGEIYLPPEWIKGDIRIEEIYVPDGYKMSDTVYYANLSDECIKILNNKSEVLGETIKENPKTGIINLIPLMIVLILLLILLSRINKKYKYFMVITLLLIAIPVIAQTGFKILKVDQYNNPIKGVKFNIYGKPKRSGQLIKKEWSHVSLNFDIWNHFGEDAYFIDFYNSFAKELHNEILSVYGIIRIYEAKGEAIEWCSQFGNAPGCYGQGTYEFDLLSEKRVEPNDDVILYSFDDFDEDKIFFITETMYIENSNTDGYDIKTITNGDETCFISMSRLTKSSRDDDYYREIYIHKYHDDDILYVYDEKYRKLIKVLEEKTEIEDFLVGAKVIIPNYFGYSIEIEKEGIKYRVSFNENKYNGDSNKDFHGYYLSIDGTYTRYFNTVLNNKERKTYQEYFESGYSSDNNLISSRYDNINIIINNNIMPKINIENVIPSSESTIEQ